MLVLSIIGFYYVPRIFYVLSVKITKIDNHTISLSSPSSRGIMSNRTQYCFSPFFFFSVTHEESSFGLIMQLIDSIFSRRNKWVCISRASSVVFCSIFTKLKSIYLFLYVVRNIYISYCSTFIPKR